MGTPIWRAAVFCGELIFKLFSGRGQEVILDCKPARSLGGPFRLKSVRVGHSSEVAIPRVARRPSGRVLVCVLVISVQREMFIDFIFFSFVGSLFLMFIFMVIKKIKLLHTRTL